MIDYVKMIDKISPKRDGSTPLSLRTMTVDIVNGDGTADLTTSGVTIPDVPLLASVSILAGDNVQVLTGRGVLLVLGPAAVDGRIPGERIATTVEDSDSSGFTTETVIISVTATLISGHTYRVGYITRIGTTSAGDVAVVRIREDNVSGTERTVDYLALPNAGTVGNLIIAYDYYEAVSSGSKTFVCTCDRQSGSGTLRREASSTRRSILDVSYVGPT